MKKVRISNTTGLQADTRVYDIETGEELQWITDINIYSIQVDREPLKVDLTLSSQSLDLIAYAMFYAHCPHCGKTIQGVAKENEHKA